MRKTDGITPLHQLLSKPVPLFATHARLLTHPSPVPLLLAGRVSRCVSRCVPFPSPFFAQIYTMGCRVSQAGP